MRGNPAVRAVLFALLSAFLAAPGAAQRRTDSPPAGSAGLAALPGQTRADVSPGAAFLASAILPGAGQYLQGADRWVPYIVLEAWAIVRYVERRSEARTIERRYRDLAWSVARRGGISVPPRRDSVFEYYEDMTRFGASGAYDADPRAAGVQPERDRETFNGQLWELAQALFSDDAQALAYYQSRAVPPTFAWAWGQSNLEQQVFEELIHESDEAFRDATTALGIVLANHMISAVDALVLARVRLSSAGERRIRLRGGFDRGRWTQTISLHF
jgi:hypothetical protein